MDIREIGLKIRELKRSRNTTVFAHHYAPSEIHEFADVLGDSRIFFEAVVAGTDAERIVVIAPSFFAEMTACLLPETEIVVPVLSQCPVATHPDLSFERISDFKIANPGTPALLRHLTSHAPSYWLTGCASLARW